MTVFAFLADLFGEMSTARASLLQTVCVQVCFQAVRIVPSFTSGSPSAVYANIWVRQSFSKSSLVHLCSVKQVLLQMGGGAGAWQGSSPSVHPYWAGKSSAVHHLWQFTSCFWPAWLLSAPWVFCCQMKHICELCSSKAFSFVPQAVPITYPQPHRCMLEACLLL